MAELNRYFWVWPLHPLKAGTWGNQRLKRSAEMILSGIRRGEEFAYRRKATGVDKKPTYLLPGERVKPPKLPSDTDPETVRIYSNRVLSQLHKTPTETQRFYFPTDDDLAMVDAYFPDGLGEPPSWPTVEAELIVGGQAKGDLEAMNAPTLLRLLERLHAIGTVNPGKAKTRRRGTAGRPSDTDRKTDKKISDMWDTGQYKTHEKCGEALGMTGSNRGKEVKRALDRHRKRRK